MSLNERSDLVFIDKRLSVDAFGSSSFRNIVGPVGGDDWGPVVPLFSPADRSNVRLATGGGSPNMRSSVLARRTCIFLASAGTSALALLSSTSLVGDAWPDVLRGP